MFVAYFDESGDPSRGSRFAVAGYVSSGEQWERFEDEWNEILASLGAKQFHMKDFAHSRGEFAHLKGKEAERKSLLEKLVATIRVRVRMSFSCVVSPDDYAAVDKQYLLSEQFGNPYSFCGRHCVARVRTWGTDNGYPLDEFRYVFEQGAKGRGLLVEVMERDGFPRPDFEGKEISPLQAADFVAWEHTKALDDAQERFRKSLLALNKIPNNWDIYTRERLEYLCQEARFERRSSDQNP